MGIPTVARLGIEAEFTPALSPEATRDIVSNMNRFLKSGARMVVAAVCATGCGSATLMHDGGTATGGSGTGQGGTAGQAPTGTGGNAGAGGKIGTGGGVGGTADTTGGGGAGGTAGTTGSGGSAGGTAGTTGSGGGAGGTAGSGGLAGASATGGAGTGGSAGSAGGSCGSQVGVSCGSTCAPGTYSCTTGTLVCNQSNASLGTSCGSNLICNGGGGCVSKTADGGSCSGNVVCQNGNCSTYSVSGASICCPAGNSNCGSCVNEQTDNGNCGACGNTCGPNRSCQTATCACQGYTLPSSCGGCGSWSFESGTAEGWTKDTDPNFPINGGGTNGATNFVATTTQKHDGNYALAVPILVDNDTTYLGSTTVPLCGNGSTLALGGFSMSAWVLIHSAAGSSLDAGSSSIFFSAWSASSFDDEPALLGDIVTDTWYHLSVTFNTAVQADHIAIYLSPNMWQGTMYIDSVTLTGP